MPVQINEVVIRAIVDSDGPAAHDQGTGAPVAINTASDMEVAEKVMEILKEKKER